MEAPSGLPGSGYLHQDYAQALSEFGEPRHLPSARGWLLARNIPGTDLSDAIGCYPLMCCQNWPGLPKDLERLDDDLITITAVTDPLASVAPAILERSFPDLVTAYKQHFVANLEHFDRASINKQHVRKAQRALRGLLVEMVDDPPSALDEWTRLYSHLVQKHGIVGPTAFSRRSFARQLRVPGLVLFWAKESGEAVAATMWFVNGRQVYYHLGASSARGYEAGASFALFWVALNHFAQRGLEIVLLGAGAGIHNDGGTDGLTRFKAGWATGTRESYLCGRICNRTVYERLAAANSSRVARPFFPLYRSHLPGF
jgi:Acetyltransferase (GNAT) domain